MASGAGHADIFISYAREDEQRVQRLCQALAAHGWSVFWDRRIPAGSTWDEYIGRALAESRCVIVAWSRVSVSSEFVREEAEHAKNRGVLVPVLLDSVSPPFGFSRIQAADLSSWAQGDGHAALEQLFADIRRLLSQSRCETEAGAQRQAEEQSQRGAEARARPTSEPPVEPASAQSPTAPASPQRVPMPSAPQPVTVQEVTAGEGPRPSSPRLRYVVLGTMAGLVAGFVTLSVLVLGGGHSSDHATPILDAGTREGVIKPPSTATLAGTAPDRVAVVDAAIQPSGGIANASGPAATAQPTDGTVNASGPATAARAALREAEAAMLYQKACDSNDPQACNELGRLYEQGTGVTRDLARAATFFQKACTGGEMWGCNNLGFFYEYGKGVTRDVVKAASFYQRACDGMLPRGCNDLGALYGKGIGVPRDDAKAAALYQRACTAGVMLACSNLGSFYLEGTGVVRDIAQAIALFRMACDHSDMLGCNNLGYLYEYGNGVAADVAKATELYQRACDNREMLGCGNLGYLYERGVGVARDMTKATSLYQKACDGGSMQACRYLASLYKDSKAVVRKRD